MQGRFSCYSNFSKRTKRVRRKKAIAVSGGSKQKPLRPRQRDESGDKSMSEAESNAPSGKRAKNGAVDAVVIKKYANRRLYNTATSSYVTLDFLADMVKNGEDFVVYDAKSGDEITHSVLTQIIFEEESKGQNLLPIQFLRQLIRFYGDSLQNFVPSYLEMSMNAFSQNQDELRQKMRSTFGATPGYAMFEEGVRKNMELYNQAMKMFSPMTNLYTPSKADESADIDDLKAQLAALQEKLEKMEDSDG